MQPTCLWHSDFVTGQWLDRLPLCSLQRCKSRSQIAAKLRSTPIREDGSAYVNYARLRKSHWLENVCLLLACVATHNFIVAAHWQDYEIQEKKERLVEVVLPAAGGADMWCTEWPYYKLSKWIYGPQHWQNPLSVSSSLASPLCCQARQTTLKEPWYFFFFHWKKSNGTPLTETVTRWHCCLIMAIVSLYLYFVKLTAVRMISWQELNTQTL